MKPAKLAVAAILVACVPLGYWALRGGSTPQIIQGDGVHGPKGMVWVPGGDFLMGSDHKLAQKNEHPAHPVRVHGFWMDKTHITNAEFAAFVKATGYVTTAERKPEWETIRVQMPRGTP